VSIVVRFRERDALATYWSPLFLLGVSSGLVAHLQYARFELLI
jgi:hypothetical protein